MGSDYSPESGRRADVDRLLDVVEDARERKLSSDQEGTTSFDWDDPGHRTLVREEFDDFSDSECVLPGFGEHGRGRTAHSDCGEPHDWICDSCGHNVEFGRTCARSVCSRCGVAWVRDSAIKKSAKVRRIRKVKHYETPDREHQKEHHVVISPDLGWYHDLAKDGYSLDEARDATKEVVKEILAEFRAQGVVARHSYRGARDDGSLASESDDRGAWKERLNSGRDFYGDVRDQLAWKPHYHSVVVSDWVQTQDFTKRFEEETGWVVHRITDDEGKSLETDGDMARALTYTISHADIDVRPDGNNRSAIWEVGTFQGDRIRSNDRFAALDADLDWADAVVRQAAGQVLGLSSASTDCGANLPPVDDPDALARRMLAQVWHDDMDGQPEDVSTDAVLHQVEQGNLQVDVSTTDGGGGSVTVRDSFGNPVGSGWSPAGGSWEFSSGGDGDAARDRISTVIVEDGDDQDDCDCGGDHGDDQDDRDSDGKCSGELIPLGEARERGLLEDDDWLAQAEHADEALQADRQNPEDMDRWHYDKPEAVSAVGAG